MINSITAKTEKMKKRVSHFIYGTGIIIAEDKKTVTIDFNGTIKKFSLFYSGTI